MNYFVGVLSPNKAKNDIDSIMLSMGFQNIVPWKFLHKKNKTVVLICKVAGMFGLFFKLKKDDVLLIQYPFKKFYAIQCHIARMKGAKCVTLIHDLGTFRRQKLTAAQEVALLSKNDAIIVHNEKMKNWLAGHGCQVPMFNLEIFDYLSRSEPETATEAEPENRFGIAYGGALRKRKNAFLFQVGPILGNCTLNVYGRADAEFLSMTEKYENICYKGLVTPDWFVAKAHKNSAWGLVWDGDSADGCSGIWGEYLRINNPHKASFYLRAGMPVIVWKDSAMADLIESNKLGIAVSSLSELPQKINSVSVADYAEMKYAALRFKDKLNDGYFFKKAFYAAINTIRKD